MDMMNEDMIEGETDDRQVKLQAIDAMLTALGMDDIKQYIPELNKTEEAPEICPTCGKPEEECECDEEGSLPMARGEKKSLKPKISVVIGVGKPKG